MGKLIDDLLSFSRMGRNAMSRERFALGALASEVIADLASEAAGRVVHWRVGALPEVTGDRSMLQVALVNLLECVEVHPDERGAPTSIGSQPSSVMETTATCR